MRWLKACLLLLVLFFFAAGVRASETGGGDGGQVYVVYLGHLPESASSEYGGPSAVEAAHHDLLRQVLNDGSSSSSTSDKILHSYKRSLNGFAARLTEQEAKKLSSMEDHRSTRVRHRVEQQRRRPVAVGQGRPRQPHGVDRRRPGGRQRELSLAGLAAGTARGAVPGARLAIYKVCHGGCGDADVLAAFDDDGVDVISFSVGNLVPTPYFEDAGAIGSFHAMRRGVVTSAAAGNSALAGGHVSNVAPWMLSVAASSIDRRFVDKIILGNGKTIVGASINTFPALQNAPLVFPINGTCEPDGLAGGSYQGKIVLCPADNDDDGPNDGTGPFMAGAAGAVIVGRDPNLSQAVILPALVVSQDQFDEIAAYVRSTNNPVGTIESTETTVDPQAPIAASFSSPGPNLITPGILKPDLAAPGVEIIASWTPLSSPTGEPVDKRRVLYNIVSGTSMACPHASGAAAYVKSHHRDWSPAMIISALVTTATPMNTPANSGSNELNYGAGQLNSSKARDPGLVYDASERDYVAMLCAQGYNATQLALITGSRAAACAGAASDLNYPTMAANVAPWRNFTVRFRRTVTNVGASPAAVYVARVVLHGARRRELAVVVSPDRLEFGEQRRTASFSVSVSGEAMEAEEVGRWCGLTASTK
ncbi:unnamed protein product [Urochloa decumbens]|uniref:Uncharacterized protein n=1 Tax=Urochloa decumbens TaxID=240449 RepID=A0ABC9FQ53_9POAL